MRRSLVLVLGLLVAGCSVVSTSDVTPGASPTLPPPTVVSQPAPDPEAAVSRFLEAWSQQDYAAMYAMLNSLSQDAISEVAFTDRYVSVWQAAVMTGLDYEIVSSLVNPQAAQVRYRLTLRSAVVGDITRETYVDLRRDENDEWKIAWTEAAILPELEGGMRLSMDYVSHGRANIYDRNGKALAVQDDIAALWIIPDRIGDFEAEDSMLTILRDLLGRPTRESISDLYMPFWDTNYYITVGEVALKEFNRVRGRIIDAGGVAWAEYAGRYYYGSGLAPHAVGYVAQIQEEQIQEYLARGYEGDEYVGQTGIEYSYEKELKGVPGGTLYVISPRGQVVGTVASRDPEQPKSIYTTLDRELQRYAQLSIAGFRGAAVVLERDTGAVLAMASSPGFDPNLFDSRNPNSGPGLTDLFRSGGDPLVNRATHGLYPLGSVFKIITMSAALESGVYTPATEYYCNGRFEELGGLVLFDWTVEKDLPPHRQINLMEGLERSCNPFFWHIGLDLYNQGLTTILPDTAKAFGLGQGTGIEIGDEAGQVPDPEWKLANVGEPWAPRDAIQLAIGQASLNVTPLQVARFVAAIGNGGTLYRPQLIQSIQTEGGEILQEFSPDPQGQLPLSPENLESVQRAMFRVTNATQGTASRYLRESAVLVKVAGKTGTAESGSGDPHAWFVGYTLEGRADRPDIAVVVIVENTGEGSSWAAPIFRRLVESYFRGGPRTRYPWESRIWVLRTATPTPGLETPTPTPTETPKPQPATETPEPTATSTPTPSGGG